MAVETSDLVPRLLDSLAEAVVVAAGDGRVLRTNEAARRMLGYKPTEVDGVLRLVDLYHRPDEVKVQREAILRRAPENPTYVDVRDLMLRARNGDSVAVRARASLVRTPEGKAVATLHTFQDLREENALKERLARVAAEVQAWEARAAAQPPLGRTTHELSQPLTAALGHIDMLLIDGGLPDSAVERLERAAEQLERLRNLVHDLTRASGVARGGRSTG